MNGRVVRALPTDRGAAAWPAAPSTQHEAFDGDLRHLLELLNTLEALSAPGPSAALRRAVEDLAESARRHFADEERLMLELGYAKSAQHAMAHWLLGEKLASALAQISAPRQTADRSRGLVANDRQALAILTRKWFLDHILAEDVPLAAALRAAADRPEAPVPAPPQDRPRPLAA